MSMRDDFSLEQKLEAMLSIALEPISAAELADVLETDETTVTTTLRALRDEYVAERRGFVFSELASGWCMQSAPDVAEWVTKFPPSNRTLSNC